MRMIGLEMRGLGPFGVVLLLSTGTVAQGQQERSASTENVIAAPSSTRGGAERRVLSERNPQCAICRDDARLISFSLSPELNQSHCSIRWIRRTAERLHPLYAGLARPGLVDAVKRGITRMYGWLNGGRMRERIAELRGALDYVLIDSPSLNAYGQASSRPGMA